MNRIHNALRHRSAASVLALAAMATGCTALTGDAAGAAPSYLIKAALPPNTGAATSPQNAGLIKLTSEYERAHPDVRVEWLPTTTSSITQANAILESEAAGGSAIDIPWEQYNTVLPGSLPNGLLQNFRSYLEQPNPYVPGNRHWLDLFAKSTIPYMTAPNGSIRFLPASNVETGMFYSKKAFAKAKITGVPTTWAAMIGDFAKLKKAGITPFIFADGSFCNPSWYERLVATSMLQGQIKQFDVDHAQTTTGLDVAIGIKKGIISMNNPRYAEVWKLLGQLVAYSYPGETSYDACSNPNATTPPLSTEPLLIQGKVGVVWGGSWYFPQLNSLGFANEYGVFTEPPITKATTPLATGTVTTGLIGGPAGPGTWSITSEQADHTMTPQKTKVVMNFLAWLFTPPHLGYWVKIAGQGADIPTEPAAPTPAVPGVTTIVPKGTVPKGVDILPDGVLGSAASNASLRLIQEYVDGSLTYTSFSSAWQSLLVSSANQFIRQNHLNLSKYL